MSEAHEVQLDLLFHALANRTRRDLLARLCAGSATMTELAAPYDMTFPAVSKHVSVLEAAGLVTRTVEGRVHRCALQPGPLQDAEGWLATYRGYWDQHLAQLAQYVETQMPPEDPDAQP